MSLQAYNPFKHDSQEANSFRSRLMELYNDPAVPQSVKYDYIRNLKKKLLDYNNKYLLAVLFPETAAPCRIPSLFAMPTAIFTHRYHYYVSTGPNGQGWVAMVPQDTSFMANYQSSLAYDGNQANVGVDMLYRAESDSRFISQNYSQVRLVGASMRLNYIGTQEQESGFMVASHVFQSDLIHLSDEIIEDGYYVTRCRPQEGTRQIYLPKDNSDHEFWDTRYKIETDLVSNQDPITFTDYTQPQTDSASLVVKVQIPNEEVVFDAFNTAGEANISANRLIGMGPKQKMGQHPQILAVYWRGMTPNQQWFRVDCERHFEGIPRTAIRDIVAVQKPVHDKKSLEAVHAIAQEPSLVSHNTQVGENLKAHSTGIIENIVNFGQKAAGFVADNLKGIGQATQMVGTLTGKPMLTAIGSGMQGIGGAQIASDHDMNKGHFGGESFTGGSTLPTIRAIMG